MRTPRHGGLVHAWHAGLRCARLRHPGHLPRLAGLAHTGLTHAGLASASASLQDETPDLYGLVVLVRLEEGDLQCGVVLAQLRLEAQHPLGGLGGAERALLVPLALQLEGSARSREGPLDGPVLLHLQDDGDAVLLVDVRTGEVCRQGDL